jgi:hypothetical protein
MSWQETFWLGLVALLVGGSLAFVWLTLRIDPLSTGRHGDDEEG